MHQTFPSVEAMLDPGALSRLLGSNVRTVVVEPMNPKGDSSTGAGFLAVRVDDEAAPSLVVKTTRRATDWVAVATGDTTDREIASWETGLLDRLPHEMGHAVVAGARFREGSALLMRNLEHHFLADGEDVTPERLSGHLRSLAFMGAAFWKRPPLSPHQPAMCDLRRLLMHLGPAVLPLLGEAVPGHFIIDLVDEGWTTLPGLVGRELADRLRSLATEPTPAVRALTGYPQTLVHGDVRPPNAAWDGQRTTLVDWARPCLGPPALDLAYLLMMSPEGTGAPDPAVGEFNRFLRSSMGASEDWAWWEEQVDVCFAAVFAMMAAAVVRGETQRSSANRPSDRVGWWAERAERGLRVVDRG